MVDVVAGDGSRIDGAPNGAPSSSAAPMTAERAHAEAEAAREAFRARMASSAMVVVRTETWVLEVPAKLERTQTSVRVAVDLERLSDATFVMLRGVHETHLSPSDALQRSHDAVRILGELATQLPPSSSSSSG